MEDTFHTKHDDVAAIGPNHDTVPTSQDHPPIKPRLGFLDIPPEVRNTIYSLLLVSDRVFEVRINRRPPRVRVRCDVFHKDRYFHLRILLSCHTIHSEAAPILYGANTLRFRNPLQMSKFLGNIQSKVKHLRRLELVEINCRETFVHTLWRLEQATALQRIHFSKLAIRRFRVVDMADDLACLAWALWNEQKNKQGVTMENIAAIFSFADHREVPRWDSMWNNDWVPQWGPPVENCEEPSIFEWDDRPSILSYSGNDIVLKRGEEVLRGDEDPVEDYPDITSLQRSRWRTRFEKTLLADAVKGNHGSRFSQPSRWNARLEETLIADLRDAEKYGGPAREHRVGEDEWEIYGSVFGYGGPNGKGYGKEA